MNLFGKKKIPDLPPPPLTPKGPSISEADREWVDSVFRWTIRKFGYPAGQTNQILFSEQYFPETFKRKKMDIDPLIDDLCNVLVLDRERMTVELVNDIRDLSFTPHVIYGTLFQSDLEIFKNDSEGNQYTILLANTLKDYPQRMMIRIILEMVKVKVAETKYTFKEQPDTPLFIYFVSIYFGFGFILASTLYDIRVEYIAGWQRSSNYSSPMPFQVMAYALAVFARLEKADTPEWSLKLSGEMKEQFNLAIKYIKNESKNSIFDEVKIKNELKASEIMNQAYSLYKENKFEQAIEGFLKALTLVEHSKTLASIYLSLGYYSLSLKKYEESIPYFINSLQFKSEIEGSTTYAYSLDNLGFAYLMIGELEKGKEYIEKAMTTGSDDKAYSLRNLGIYYMKLNELDKAEEYFQKAFAMNKKVDLLELFYAQFLFQKGNKKEGLRYLEMAVEKGEPEAIEYMNELN